MPLCQQIIWSDFEPNKLSSCTLYLLQYYLDCPPHFHPFRLLVLLVDNVEKLKRYDGLLRGDVLDKFTATSSLMGEREKG